MASIIRDALIEAQAISATLNQGGAGRLRRD